MAVKPFMDVLGGKDDRKEKKLEFRVVLTNGDKLVYIEWKLLGRYEMIALDLDKCKKSLSSLRIKSRVTHINDNCYHDSIHAHACTHT